MINCGKCEKPLTLKEFTNCLIQSEKVNSGSTGSSLIWCHDCYTTYSVTCKCCDGTFDHRITTKIDKHYICNGCIVRCDKCSWQGSYNDVEWPDDIKEAKCPSCYAREYSYCNECFLEYNNTDINNSSTCPDCNTIFRKIEHKE